MADGGYQGYIATRAVRGDRIPQSVQNLVVRDYARRKGLDAGRLPQVEYGMPGCTMVLESVLADMSGLQGIILYSLFLLPEDPARRRTVYDRVLAAGAEIHGALEGVAIRDEADVARVEDTFRIAALARSGTEELRALLAGA